MTIGFVEALNAACSSEPAGGQMDAPTPPASVATGNFIPGATVPGRLWRTAGLAFLAGFHLMAVLVAFSEADWGWLCFSVFMVVLMGLGVAVSASGAFTSPADGSSDRGPAMAAGGVDGPLLSRLEVEL